MLKLIQSLFSGASNKALVVAAGALLNDAVTGNWTDTTAIVGYVATVLVWLIPNVEKAVKSDNTTTAAKPS